MPKQPAKPEPKVTVTTTVTSKQPEPPVEPKTYDWRDPDATFADDDKSLDAELWRMAQRQEGKR